MTAFEGVKIKVEVEIDWAALGEDLARADSDEQAAFLLTFAGVLQALPGVQGMVQLLNIREAITAMAREGDREIIRHVTAFEGMGSYLMPDEAQSIDADAAKLAGRVGFMRELADKIEELERTRDYVSTDPGASLWQTEWSDFAFAIDDAEAICDALRAKADREIQHG